MTEATQAFVQPRLPMAALVGATLRTFARAPGTFVALAAIAAIPAIVSLTLVRPVVGLNTTYLVTKIIKTILLCVPQIAMCYVAVRCLEGRPFGLAESLALGVRRWFPVLVTVLLVTLVYYVGLALLIVPGVLVALICAVVFPVCAIEGRGPIESLRRSRELTRDNRWRILGAYLIFFAPIIIVAFGVGVVAAMRKAQVTGQRVNEVIEIFWLPFATIFNAALFFALRRMKSYDDSVVAVFE